MSNKNQKDRPMFAEMNISGRPTELLMDAEYWLSHDLKHIGSTKPEDFHRLLPIEWTE